MLLFSLESLPQAISGPGEHFFCVPAIPAQGIKACKAAQDGWKGHLLLSMCKQMLFFFRKMHNTLPACMLLYLSLSLFLFFFPVFCYFMCSRGPRNSVFFFFPLPSYLNFLAALQITYKEIWAASRTSTPKKMTSLHPVVWFGCTGGLYLKNRLPRCNGRGKISQKASPKRQNHPSFCKNHHDLLMGPTTTCIAKDTPFLHYSKPITHLGTEEIPMLTSL